MKLFERTKPYTKEEEEIFTQLSLLIGEGEEEIRVVYDDDEDEEIEEREDYEI